MKYRGTPFLITLLAVTGFACAKDERPPTSDGNRPASNRGTATAATAAKQSSGVERGEFHFLFTGIGTLKKNEQGDVQTYDIPLIDKDRPANSMAKPHTIPVHEGFLVFDPALLVKDESGRAVDGDGRTKGQKIVYLDKDELFVSDVKPAKLTTESKPRGADCAGSYETDARNLYWIPSIALAGDYAGAFKDVALNGRVPLTGGWIDAYVPDGRVHQFQDKHGHQTHKQAIAQIIDWSFNVPSDTVTIFRRPVGVEGAKAEVLLILKKAYPDGSQGAVIIGSARRGEITEPRKTGHSKAPDHHFEVYYDALKSPRYLAIPYPVTTCGSIQTLPTWVPKWLGGFRSLERARDWNPTGAQFESSGSVDVLVIGGMNCGPDGQP